MRSSRITPGFCHLLSHFVVFTSFPVIEFGIYVGEHSDFSIRLFDNITGRDKFLEYEKCFYQ